MSTRFPATLAIVSLAIACGGESSGESASGAGTGAAPHTGGTRADAGGAPAAGGGSGPGSGGTAGAAGTGPAGGAGGSAAGCEPPCDVNAICTESGSTLTCECKPGYQGDGWTCNDVDECNQGTDNCDKNATCTNASGGFNCTCKSGWIGDGLTCTLSGNYTCVSPTIVPSLPFSITADTTGASNNHGYGGTWCPPETVSAGGGTPDHVYAYTATQSGQYRISLTGKNFDTALYVVKDCNSIWNSCMGANQLTCTNCTESLELTFAAGLTYYIIVDGSSNSDPADAGQYTLLIEQLGLCASPKLVSSVPFSAKGYTTGATNDHGFSPGACPGETGGWGKGAPDEVYAFTPPNTGTYDVKLTAQDFDSVLYVAGDCAAVDATCIAAKQLSCSACTESVAISAVAGTTYYIIVDGSSNSSSTNAGLSDPLISKHDFGAFEKIRWAA